VATLSKQGIVPVLEHERRREVHLELRQSLAALREQLAARENQLTTSRLALEQLPGTSADKLQVLQKELLEADQRIAEIEGRRAFVVRAPAAGRISALQASVGRAADPRQPQLSILPKDGRLEARLFVPTRAVGFVRTGQEVRILYDAFPFQRFGAHAGRVTRVTRSVLTPTDLVAPIVPQEAVYEVTVKLAHQDVQADGVTVPLRADMLLKADIILERRSLLRWLLDPLLQARMH
jgi:membrane fusion protein